MAHTWKKCLHVVEQNMAKYFTTDRMWVAKGLISWCFGLFYAKPVTKRIHYHSWNHSGSFAVLWEGAQPLSSWFWPFCAIWVLQKLGALAADVWRAKSSPVSGNYQPAEKQWSHLQPGTGRAHRGACLVIPVLLGCPIHCSTGMVTQFMHSWLHHHEMPAVGFAVLRVFPVRSKGKAEQLCSPTHTVLDLTVRDEALWGKNFWILQP